MATMNATKAAAIDAKNAAWVQTAKGRGYAVALRVYRHQSGLFRVFASATRECDASFCDRYLASFHTKAQADGYRSQIEAA